MAETCQCTNNGTNNGTNPTKVCESDVKLPVAAESYLAYKKISVAAITKFVILNFSFPTTQIAQYLHQTNNFVIHPL